jgi:AcrR family transcriptional regulator
LLADDGARGLSHLKVDRAAGVPDGTTSFYYRTKSALLHGIADRIAELDLAALAAVVSATANSAGQSPQGPQQASRLATAVFNASREPALSRTKARIELSLHADRDPALAAKIQVYFERFQEMIRDVVAGLTLDDGSDAALLKRQQFAVMMFIGGVMAGLAMGFHTVDSAEQIDHHIAAIIAGEHATPIVTPTHRDA